MYFSISNINFHLFCSCPLTHVGELCQFSNPCQPSMSQCQNGGKCVPLIQSSKNGDGTQQVSFQCECPVGKWFFNEI